MILATLPLMSIVLIFLISVGTSFMINVFLLKKKHFKINISKKFVIHTKKKHIAIKYNYLRELGKDKEVRFEYVNTKEKITNIFTKDSPKYTHEYLRGKLGVIPIAKVTLA